MAHLDRTVSSFWDWFTAHKSEFAGLSSQDEPFWDLALDRLKAVDSRLWFELSTSGAPVREFVITAEGNVGAFPVVEALAASAPKTEGWNFVALKPSMGFEFRIEYEGVQFDPQTMWFLPLESTSRPHDLGLRIGIEQLGSIERRKAENAVEVILDTGLGERSAAVDVQHIEVSELPADPESDGYIELSELCGYIAWRKNRLGVPT